MYDAVLQTAMHHISADQDTDAFIFLQNTPASSPNVAGSNVAIPVAVAEDELAKKGDGGAGIAPFEGEDTSRSSKQERDFINQGLYGETISGTSPADPRPKAYAVTEAADDKLSYYGDGGDEVLTAERFEDALIAPNEQERDVINQGLYGEAAPMVIVEGSLGQSLKTYQPFLALAIIPVGAGGFLIWRLFSRRNSMYSGVWIVRYFILTKDNVPVEYSFICNL